MSNVEKILGTVIILFLIVLSTASSTYAVYRKTYPITRSGSLYVIELNITINKIGDYGVFTTYIKPEGVYAYGIIMMKNPNDKYPVAYIMAGTQNNWYYYREISSKKLYLRIFIDFNSSKILVVDRNCIKREYKINYKPMIKYLYISNFNITGKKYPQPDIDINQLRVYVSNKTINNISNNICAPELGLGTLVINISHTPTKTTTTSSTTTQSPTETTSTSTQQTTTKTITSPQKVKENMIFLIFLIPLIGAIIIGLLLLTHKKRSPGP